MIQREIANAIKEAASQYPIVTITGPRQVGKTTLIRHIFPDRPYVNLEEPDTREFALNDPIVFMRQFPDGAIIDEAQYAPKLLSYIQVIVDEKKRNGMYFLTGSQQLNLHGFVAQSLAGRTSLIRMMPLTIGELAAANIHLSLDEYLLKGFLPRIYSSSANVSNIYRDYVSTYLERDVRQVSNVHDLAQFQKFLYLCSSRVGCVLNHSSLANDVGVSSTTIQHWLSILEASYLIFRLQPYYENLGKRVIKSPKLYFFDVGLAAFLQGFETTQQILHDKARGHLFENLVVLEFIKARENNSRDPNLYFYRDSHHQEVDLIYKNANELIPIEIKSSESFDKSYIKSLSYFRKITPKRVPTGYVVYAGEYEYVIDGFKLCNYKHVGEIVRSQHVI